MTITLLAGWCHGVLGQPAEASGSDPRGHVIQCLAGERGPHHRDWLKVTLITNRLGQVQFQTNLAYVELSTALHHWDSGEWKESREEFEITPDGYAVASQGQVQAIISPVLNDANGAVELHTPDGKRMRSTILALMLYNRVTGQSLRVAEVSPEAVGVLVAPNSVLFTNAFEGFGAHVRYVYEKARFHQDVVLAERLDHSLLAAAGFPAADSVLEIWTAFLEAEAPEITSRVVRQELSPLRRLQMEEPDIITHHLDFGALKMPTGQAYLEDVAGGEPQPIEVSKRWIEAEGNRYLVECIPLDQAEDLFAQLPETVPSGEDWLKDKPLYASRQVPAPELARKQDETILLADMNSSPAMGSGPMLVMDYVTVTTGYWPGDYTFQGGTTYYVTGPFNVGGTLTIEGGSVIKHAESITGGIVAYGDIRFETRLYRPAILTSKNDNSVGESISDSSGNPSTYSCSALIFDVGSTLLTPVEYLHIRYASVGLEYVQDTTSLRHCQFVNVGDGIRNYVWGAALPVQNVLFSAVSGYALGACCGQSSAFTAEHLTVDNVAQLLAPNATLDAVNSLFVNVASMGVGFNPDPATCREVSGNTPFTVKGGGRHYLEDESSYRIGTVSIDAELLNDLQFMTTFPPYDPPSWPSVTGSASWTSLVHRELEYANPMIGYHYAVLDFLFPTDVPGLTLNIDASLDLTFVPAIGITRQHGFILDAGSRVSIKRGDGLVDCAPMTQIVLYSTVQEEPMTGADFTVSLFSIPNTGGSPTIDVQFTSFSGLGTRLSFFNPSVGPQFFSSLKLEDCQLSAVNLLVPGQPVAGNCSEPARVLLQNNHFERSDLRLFNGCLTVGQSQYQNPMAVSLHHNTFCSGVLWLAYQANNAQCLPEWYASYNSRVGGLTTWGSGGAYANHIHASHNAYTVAFPAPWQGPGDVLLSSPEDIVCHHSIFRIPWAPPFLTAVCVANRILLRWTIAPSLEGQVSDFVIKRATTPSGPYTIVATVPAGQRSFIDTVAEGTYCYVVVARILDPCTGQLQDVPSYEVCESTCLPPPCEEPLISGWFFTDQGFIAGGQAGELRSYQDPSEVPASPWSFPASPQCIVPTGGLLLRMGFENDTNCTGQHGPPFNPNPHQIATAEAVISLSCQKRLRVNWCGVGERHQPLYYELMTLNLDGGLVADAHAPGDLGTECLAGMGSTVPRSGTPQPPQELLLAPGFHVFRVWTDTGDEQFHWGAYYEFEFTFLEP